MAIDTYTTYSEIRAVCGVSDEELEDVTLGLSVYDIGLKMALTAVGAGIPALFATVSALTKVSRTESQQSFYEAVKLFAPYAVGMQLRSALPMLGPKSISDGKASMSRFSDSPYKATIEGIEQMFESSSTILKSAYLTLAGSSSSVSNVPGLLSVASPTVNRVTGS